MNFFEIPLTDPILNFKESNKSSSTQQINVMNIKPFYQQVTSKVALTQDGGKINPADHYGLFLSNLIKANTEKQSTAIDMGEVDTEELASNLRYAIHEFTKALKAVETFNK